jgi:hypothetical protein
MRPAGNANDVFAARPDVTVRLSWPSQPAGRSSVGIPRSPSIRRSYAPELSLNAAVVRIGSRTGVYKAFTDPDELPTCVTRDLVSTLSLTESSDRDSIQADERAAIWPDCAFNCM